MVEEQVLARELVLVLAREQEPGRVAEPERALLAEPHWNLAPRSFDSRYHRNAEAVAAFAALEKWLMKILQRMWLELHRVRRLCTVGQRAIQRTEAARC